MIIVPLQAVPNQTLFVTLGGQNCQLNVYQKRYGLFMDVFVQGGAQTIVTGVLASNLNLIVLSAYLGFVGDFMFFDSQGQNNPTYDGLGTRYNLMYLSPGDIPADSIAAWAGLT